MFHKRIIYLVLVILALFAISTCAKQVDVVNGVPPISRSLADIAETQRALAALPADQRGAYLERHWPHLSQDIVWFLRRNNKISESDDVNRVEFRYGSLDKIYAEQRDGQRRYGFFQDQIVAIVYISGKMPVPVLVQCLNGMFTTIDDLARLQPIGTHSPQMRFRIGYREGLVHHLDYPAAIDVAEYFNLPLYSGRKIGRNRITPAQARLMESDTNRRQVTVYVVEGDHFDLVNMRFTPSRNHRNPRS